MCINAFPKELTELRNWINWRYIPCPKGGKDKKPPFSPITGKNASVSAQHGKLWKNPCKQRNDMHIVVLGLFSQRMLDWRQLM